MNIQINNDFQLALSVLANGTAEPLTYATNIEVAVQNLDAPRVLCTLAPVVVNENVVTVAVDSTVLNTTGRYLAAITYVINGARRYAENGDAFTLVRSAAEADIEGESAAADLHVKFEASGINGLSAYELAKQAGYAGTFEQWLYAGENANNAAAMAAGAANQAADAANIAYGAATNASSAAARANTAAETANAAAAGIGDEVTRLDTRITEETTRAQAAEQANVAAITAETARAEKAETFLTPVPNTYWRLIDVGSKSVLQTNSRYESIIIPVREGDRFIVTAQGDGYARTWGILGKDKYVLRCSDVYPLTNEEVIIATGEHYLVVNSIATKTWDVRTTSTAADILQQFIVAEDRATERALRNLFVAAGALYNDTTATIMRTAPWGESVQHLAGHYYLNGLGDITEEQMMVIYSVGNRGLRELAYTNELARTFITKRAGNTSYFYESSLRGCFFACNNIETLGDNTESLYCKNSVEGFFRNCSKLKYINLKYILLRYATSVNNMFGGCKSLIKVLVGGIAQSISFSDSPHISKDSILFLIENAVPTTAITITLHADAYARLENDAEIVAALEAQPLVTLVSA